MDGFRLWTAALALLWVLAACCPAIASATYITHDALHPAELEAGDEFGTAVATDGTTVVVSALGDDTDGLDAGAASVYRRVDDVDTAWTRAAALLASDGADGYQFGSSAAVDGDLVVVGAQRADSGYAGVTANGQVCVDSAQACDGAGHPLTHSPPHSLRAACVTGTARWRRKGPLTRGWRGAVPLPAKLGRHGRLGRG